MLPFGAGTEFYFCGLFAQPSLLGTRAGDRTLHDPIPPPEPFTEPQHSRGLRGPLRITQAEPPQIFMHLNEFSPQLAPFQAFSSS